MQNTLTKIPSNWNKIPKVSTRSELLEQRKKDILPDISYELNEVINSKDCLISKKFDLNKDGKLALHELAKTKAIQPVIDDNLEWGIDSSGVNRSFRIVQSRGNVIMNEEFIDVQNTSPVLPNENNSKVKSKTELEAKRKEEIKVKGKVFEKKMKKEYVRRETEKERAVTSVGRPADYRENPTYKTKQEMEKGKKEKMLEDLNKSCNFNHKTQYERIVIREKILGASSGRDLTPLHEKLRQQNMQHYSDTFGKRPMGLHGTELPKFSDNLKEYWTFKSDYQISSKKLTITKQSKFTDAESSEDSKKIIIHKKKENFKKPTEEDFPLVNVDKEHCRNNRWTNYHYNFLQKVAYSDQTHKLRVKSATPEEQSKTKSVKTPRSLMAQRMQKRGSFSPGKDQFRSTGFTYSQY